MSNALSRNGFENARPGPVVVFVMDGVANGPDYVGNAVKHAQTPHLDRLLAKHPTTDLFAHGVHVGMPSEDDMGNSEVGHNALGAGRIFDQGAKLVQHAVNDGSMFEDAGWQEIIQNVTKNDSTLHLMGLYSDGNVHAHVDHVQAMVKAAKQAGVKRVALHTLLDGRDVAPTSALEYIEPLEAFLKEVDENYGIASGGGRQVITMDRYNANWPLVERGWKAHVLGEADRFPSASDAIKALREQNPGIIDQDLPPFVVERGGEPFGTIEDGDSVVFWNFRGDRAIEITRAFTGEVPFDRQRVPDVCFAGMMQYDGDTNTPERYLVRPPAFDNTMGELLAKAGVPQLAVSETQKYGHVTYFWNGNKSGYFDQSIETYIEVPSDMTPFEYRPWMKAVEITDRVIDELTSNRDLKFARVNFPNGDMVGHTGDFQAARMSVEAVDLCIKRILPVIEKLGGIAIFTADHGNADEMFEYDAKTLELKLDKDGKPKPMTKHTLNKVPCVIYDPAFKGEYELAPPADAGISNIAATGLELLGFNAPEDYRPSLIKLKH